VGRILFFLTALLPWAFIIFIVIRIHYRDYPSTCVLLAELVMVMIVLVMLRAGHLRQAVFILSLSLLATITVICTLGQGVHDVTMVAYPALMVISSLLLRKYYFIFFTALSIISIGWLVAGDYFGWYITLPHGPGDFTDYLVISVILVLTAFLVHILAENLHQSLRRAREEISERRKIEESLKVNLREKEILLNEVHHRVKNNLSVIMSLLNLQAKYINTKKQALEAFEETRSRIYSMALVHNTLYHSGALSRIAFRAYVESLVNELRTIYLKKGPVTITMDVKDIDLDIDKAIPCGMIINELTTNALKHAFPGGKKGTIRIMIGKNKRGNCRLRVKDNGTGLPPGIDFENPATMGFQIVTLLTRQLDGSLRVDGRSGTCFEVTVPLGDNEPAHAP